MGEEKAKGLRKEEGEKEEEKWEECRQREKTGCLVERELLGLWAGSTVECGAFGPAQCVLVRSRLEDAGWVYTHQWDGGLAGPRYHKCRQVQLAVHVYGEHLIYHVAFQKLHLGKVVGNQRRPFPPCLQKQGTSGRCCILGTDSSSHGEPQVDPGSPEHSCRQASPLPFSRN